MTRHRSNSQDIGVNARLLRPLVGVIAAALLVVGCGVSGNGTRIPLTSRSSVTNESSTRGQSHAPAASPGRPLIVGNLGEESITVACAPGTSSLGVRTGYYDGKPIRIRLCAVRGFRSAAPESTPGTDYYIRGSRGNVIVNARVSRAVLALFKFVRTRGLTLTANSSYRSMRYQRVLCADDRDCRHGNYVYVARPGWSNHQLGVAIDFAGIYGTGGRSCAGSRAIDLASPSWQMLNHYAHRFGFRQYAAESWHWDALTGPDRC